MWYCNILRRHQCVYWTLLQGRPLPQTSVYSNKSSVSVCSITSKFGLSLSLTKFSFNFSEIVRENLWRVVKVRASTGMVCTCSRRRSALFSATTATNVLTFLLLCLSIGSLRKVWNPLPNATHYLTAVAPYPDELHFLKCTGLSRECCCEVLEGNPVWTKVVRNDASFEVGTFMLMKIQIF